mgnify:FL=1
MKNSKIPIINQQGEITGEKSISGDTFGKEVSSFLITQAIRAFMSNQRKAKAKAKTRAEVTGSSAKIWRQKGTGRARHGDRQAPIFVGGGKAFGPTGGQNYKLKLNKKSAGKVILAVLGQKIKDKKTFLIEEMKITKTKEAFSFIEKVREKFLLKGKLVLISDNEEIKKYFRNLEKIKMLEAKTLNVYHLLETDAVLLTARTLETITQKK